MEKSVHDPPLISVITLSYFSEDLYQTILSVLEQTYKKIQYILIDDGSFNFDAKKVHHFIETNKKNNVVDFQVYHNKINKGTVYTANMAFSYANGEYLFYLSANDCFYDKEVLTGWVNEFIERDALFITGLRAVHDDLQQPPLSILPTSQQINLIKRASSTELFEELCKENFIFGCCTARSKKAIEKFGLYDETYRLLEDYPMNLHITRLGANIDIWERIVIKYKLGGSSSPRHFNSVYEKDADTCLKKEILPYTQHPIFAYYCYHKWKFKHKQSGKLSLQLQKYGNNVTIKLFIYLLHPIYALKTIKHFIFTH